MIAIAGFFTFQLLIEHFPQLFHPLYNRGYYSNLDICPDCQRTIDTAKETYGQLGAFLFLAVATLLKNKNPKYFILPVSLGFALTFSLGGFLHNLQPGLTQMPWWKIWEFTIGFGGGMSLFLSFWIAHSKGIIHYYMQNKYDGSKHVNLWLGFWIPFYLAVGELARDRIQQIAKVWYKIYDINYRELFSYFETAVIIITALFFLFKVFRYFKRNMQTETLLVNNPVKMFFILYSAFFWLIMFRWIHIPFTIENNIITILTIFSYTISVFVFWRLTKDPVFAKKMENTTS